MITTMKKLPWTETDESPEISMTFLPLLIALLIQHKSVAAARIFFVETSVARSKPAQNISYLLDKAVQQK